MLLALWIKGQEKKPIKIEPIQIESSSTTQKDSSLTVKKEEPMDILSKLKVATQTSTEGIVPSKEEVSKKVLASLRESVEEQAIDEPVPLKPTVQKIAKQDSTKRDTHKKSVVKKHLAVTKAKVTKKRVPIKTTKIIKKKKATKRVKVTTKHQDVKSTKVVIKQPIERPINVTKSTTSSHTKTSKLSREEEVALYHQKYASSLEVVSVTKPFTIEEKKSVPDEYYFEPQKPIETTTNPNPTKFVKTLGVVAVSNAYETPLVVPKKVEVAKEGIVEFKNAKLETEEMKRLKFVKPLEVVEVSKPFETIEAEKYLK